LFELVELFIVSSVFYDSEFIVSSSVGMDSLSLWMLVGLLLLFVLEKIWLFVEILAPAPVSNPVVTFIIFKNIRYYFCIFLTQFFRFRLALLYELDPVVHRSAQKMEDEL